jgi:hypothetical protein
MTGKTFMDVSTPDRTVSASDLSAALSEDLSAEALAEVEAG